jgi:hypothetical protein
MDTDGDGIGDVCDFPDLYLDARYEQFSETELESGDTELVWVMKTTLENLGTDSVPAGTEVTVTWKQHAVVDSSETGAHTEQNAQAMLHIDAIDDSGIHVQVAPLDQDGGDSQFDAYVLAPLERTQRVQLTNGLAEDGSLELSDQTFRFTIAPNGCAAVYHEVDFSEEPEVRELNEDNQKLVLAFDSLSDCLEVSIGFDPKDFISGIVGPALNTDFSQWQEWEVDTTLAGLNEVYGILREITAWGGMVESPTGMFRVTFPGGAVQTNTSVQIREGVNVDANTINPVCPIYSIEAGRGIRFNASVEVTIRYDDAMLPKGTTENSLGIFSFNGFNWMPLPSTVNPTENSVSAFVNHFSLFAVAVSEPAGLSYSYFNSSTKTVHVPCLDLGATYWLDLKIINFNPLTFELVDFDLNENAGLARDCAEYDVDTSTLHIPSLDLNKAKFFWADLSITRTDPIQLQLKGVGEEP